MERQKLIDPVEPTWEQRVEQWNAIEYQRKEFEEGMAVILTQKGERVRSKSEKILADYFYQNGIPYKYEMPLYLKGFGVIHPDFTFLFQGELKKKYTGNITGEWMIPYTREMQSEKYRHMRNVGYIQEKI